MDIQDIVNTELSETDLTKETSQVENDNSTVVPVGETSDSCLANKSAPVKSKYSLVYGILATPAWHQCVLLGLQHYMALFFSALSKPYLLVDNMCIDGDPTIKAELMGSMLQICAVLTILQITIGVRLPVIQSASFSILLPTLSYLQLSKNSCPVIKENCSVITGNISCVETGSEDYHALWKSRLQVIQGSLMVASSMEILIGMTGVIGFLMKYIGPLTIGPAITLLGISLFKTTARYASKNWLLCLISLVILTAFSQYMKNLTVPVPKCTRGCRLKKVKYPLFKMFPVILAVLLSWLVCFILTVTNAIPNESSHWAYGARTDVHSDILSKAPWFTVYWPGKYGLPKVDVALIVGLLAGILASIIESVGDYYMCAELVGVPPPPKSAINRGITTEGIGCFFAGLFGTGNGSTTMSQNIAIINLTGVGSKRVILTCAFIMFSFGILNKIGTLFVTIPEPIFGALFMVLFGLIVAIGIKYFRHVDLRSPRNLFIIGNSIFIGLVVSQSVAMNPNFINTGIEVVDNTVMVLLTTSMFVGGVLGFLLDNTLPGTPEERGLLFQEIDDSDHEQDNVMTARNLYEIPMIGKSKGKLKYNNRRRYFDLWYSIPLNIIFCWIDFMIGLVWEAMYQNR